MDEILSLLGLIFRANKLLLGDNCLENMSSIRYLFLASDISDKQKDRYLKKVYFYKIDYNDSYSSEELSKSIGKSNIKVIGVIDKGFAESIRKKEGK